MDHDSILEVSPLKQLKPCLSDVWSSNGLRNDCFRIIFCAGLICSLYARHSVSRLCVHGLIHQWTISSRICISVMCSGWRLRDVCLGPTYVVSSSMAMSVSEVGLPTTWNEVLVRCIVVRLIGARKHWIWLLGARWHSWANSWAANALREARTDLESVILWIRTGMESVRIWVVSIGRVAHRATCSLRHFKHWIHLLL